MNAPVTDEVSGVFGRGFQDLDSALQTGPCTGDAEARTMLHHSGPTCRL